MLLMQQGRNGKYAAFYKQSLQTRGTSTHKKHKQAEKKYFSYPTPSFVLETQNQPTP